jgi:hypothetical protein
MATRQEQIDSWVAKGYSIQLATQIVNDLNPTAAAARAPAPIAAPKKAAAPGTATHHPDCGDVGETGEHGELGSNAAPAVEKQKEASSAT